MASKLQFKNNGIVDVVSLTRSTSVWVLDIYSIVKKEETISHCPTRS